MEFEMNRTVVILQLQCKDNNCKYAFFSYNEKKKCWEHDKHILIDDDNKKLIKNKNKCENMKEFNCFYLNYTDTNEWFTIYKITDTCHFVNENYICIERKFFIAKRKNDVVCAPYVHNPYDTGAWISGYLDVEVNI